MFLPYVRAATAQKRDYFLKAFRAIEHLDVERIVRPGAIEGQQRYPLARFLDA